MKIKLDENLPAGLSPVLEALGHDVDTAMAEGLAGHNDDAVWKATQRSGRFLVTQDLDFSDLRRFEPGSHHGLLLVRLRDPGRLALSGRVSSLFRSENTDTWEGCFVVATDHKLRIRRPV